MGRQIELTQIVVPPEGKMSQLYKSSRGRTIADGMYRHQLSPLTCRRSPHSLAGDGPAAGIEGPQACAKIRLRSAP